MVWIEGIATASVVLSLLCFAIYVVALLQMPTGHRPKIIPVDRLGRSLPASENPDYHDTDQDALESSNCRGAN